MYLLIITVMWASQPIEIEIDHSLPGWLCEEMKKDWLTDKRVEIIDAECRGEG